jgi:hypothetical protein
VDEVCSKAGNPTPRKRGSPLVDKTGAKDHIRGCVQGLVKIANQMDQKSQITICAPFVVPPFLSRWV